MAQIRSTRRAVILGMLASVPVAAWASDAAIELGNGADLSVEAAYTLAAADEIILLDVRRPDEWQATGIPRGAVPLDMRREDFLDEVKALQSANPDKPMAIICARGGRTTRLLAWFDANGLPPVHNVPEGMLGSAVGPGWLKQGLPVDAPS